MSSEEYLILFGDLIGSTEVASEASPLTYSKLYISSFHLAANCSYSYITDKVFDKVRFKKIIDRPKIAGDEVLSFTPIKYEERRGATLPTTEAEDLIASAIAYSFVLKLFWMASPYNLLRLADKKFPRDISVGIHLGPAERIFDDEKSDVAGLHINVAKRLESAGRSGQQSRIFVSDDVEHIFNKWKTAYEELPTKEAPPLIYTDFVKLKSPLNLKGIPVRVSPYELMLDQNDLMKMQELVTLSYDSPAKNDAEVETAVEVFKRIFLETFFSPKFSSLRNMLDENLTQESYISDWFKAIPSIPQIFFYDVWTAMIAFFISCGFVRHKQLTADDMYKYHEATDVLKTKLQKELSKKK